MTWAWWSAVQMTQSFSLNDSSMVKNVQTTRALWKMYGWLQHGEKVNPAQVEVYGLISGAKHHSPDYTQVPPCHRTCISFISHLNFPGSIQASCHFRHMEFQTQKPSSPYQVPTHSWVSTVHVWQSALPRSTTSQHNSAQPVMEPAISLVSCTCYHWATTPHMWQMDGWFKHGERCVDDSCGWLKHGEGGVAPWQKVFDIELGSVGLIKCEKISPVFIPLLMGLLCVIVQHVDEDVTLGSICWLLHLNAKDLATTKTTITTGKVYSVSALSKGSSALITIVQLIRCHPQPQLLYAPHRTKTPHDNLRTHYKGKKGLQIRSKRFSPAETNTGVNKTKSVTISMFEQVGFQILFKRVQGLAGSHLQW